MALLGIMGGSAIIAYWYRRVAVVSWLAAGVLFLSVGISRIAGIAIVGFGLFMLMPIELAYRQLKHRSKAGTRR